MNGYTERFLQSKYCLKFELPLSPATPITSTSSSTATTRSTLSSTTLSSTETNWTTTYSSTESPEPDPKTLDALYEIKLETIFKNLENDTEDIDPYLYRKWVARFGMAKEHEKMARNCLVELMLQQLIKNGQFDEPFTDLRNLEKSLHDALTDLDDDDSSVSLERDPKPGQDYMERWLDDIGKHFNKSKNMDINQLKKENDAMKEELAKVCLKISDEQIKRQRMEEKMRVYESRIAAGFENRTTFNKQEMVHIIKSIRHGIRKIEKRQHMWNSAGGDGPQKNFKFLSYMFGKFAKTQEVKIKYAGQDQQLYDILKRKIYRGVRLEKHKMSAEVREKFGERKRVIKERYNRAFRMHSWSKHLHERLALMRCVSALRQSILDRQQECGGGDDLWVLLQVLEEKYAAILQEA